MIRKELIGYLNTLTTEAIGGRFEQPYRFDVNGARYSAASGAYQALFLLDSTVEREIESDFQERIRQWFLDDMVHEKKTVSLSDLRQWCAPHEKPQGWTDEETNESGVDYPCNLGTLFGVRLNRQLLWQLIAPLPGDTVVVSVPKADDSGVHKPFFFQTTEWVAVLMPHHQGRTLLEAENYPEYIPSEET